MFKKVQCVLLNDLFISPSCRRRPQVRALYMTWKYTRSDTQVTGKLLEDKGAASLRKQSSWVGVDLRGRRVTVVCGNNPQPPLRCVSGLQTENSGFNWNQGVLKCQRETLGGEFGQSSAGHQPALSSTVEKRMIWSVYQIQNTKCVQPSRSPPSHN